MGEFSEMRSTLAEITATLVGFAVIFGAFTAQRGGDGHSRERLTVIVEVGLVVIALCLLPELLVGWGLSKELALRALSALSAIYWIRWFIENYRIWGADHITPILFRAAVALDVIVFVCHVANSALIGTDALYTTGVFAALALVMVAFLAQFRVERA